MKSLEQKQKHSKTQSKKGEWNKFEDPRLLCMEGPVPQKESLLSFDSFFILPQADYSNCSMHRDATRDMWCHTFTVVHNARIRLDSNDW